MTRLFALMAVAFAALAPGQAIAEEPAGSQAVPATVEYYYRVKWGSLKEFLALYERNHQPLLEEMRKEGFISAMKTEFPFTHMAGGQRWDVRVRITFRDAAAAINDPRWEIQWAAAKERLYKDQRKFEAEEGRRFSLLEEHWDVIVSDFPG